MILHSRQLVFVHVPKAAGTSITAALATLAVAGDAVRSGHDQHATLLEIYAEFPAVATYRSFAVRRDHDSTVESDYRFCRMLIHEPPTGHARFDEKIATVRAGCTLGQFRNWFHPGDWWDHFTAPGVSTVLRFDHLAEDWAALGQEWADWPQLPWLNKSE